MAWPYWSNSLGPIPLEVRGGNLCPGAGHVHVLAARAEICDLTVAASRTNAETQVISGRLANCVAPPREPRIARCANVDGQPLELCLFDRSRVLGVALAPI
jgi:hypothetical protein